MSPEPPTVVGVDGARAGWVAVTLGPTLLHAYDDLVHATEPFSPLALRALRNHVETWEVLVDAARAAWERDYVLAFTPDHGAHVDPATGRGTHGDDRDEDMRLTHFFVVA